MITVYVKSEPLLELLRKLRKNLPEAKKKRKDDENYDPYMDKIKKKFSLEEAPETFNFMPRRSYILVDIHKGFAEPQTYYDSLHALAKKAGATLFILPMHGNSRALCKNFASQTHRKLCHMLSKKNHIKFSTGQFNDLLPKHY